ncbi:MAG: acyl-ACP--UDP-N-acetylglucosamine O-acyltransferase [Gammaproteobacteria bacterium]|nr:acyl-ACP--UDP-N-acetylglucosamine O-acyltransferase [Gammaproteobacteria bacterium]
MSRIHPTAIIDPGANLHESVRVGPYSIIESDVVIGPDCRIESSTRIYSGTHLGQGNRVCHGAMLGCEPQDLSFDPSASRPLIIGDRNHFKEGTNISRGVKTESGTLIGNDNYFMGSFHAGHDCIIGNHNVLGHGSVLAGHVTIGDHVFISGIAAIHQFTYIGDRVMIAGCAKIVKDIPPYSIGDGNPARVSGLNSIGLRRAGFSAQTRRLIKQAYRTIFQSGENIGQALESMKLQSQAPEVDNIIHFFERSQRGVTAHR